MHVYYIKRALSLALVTVALAPPILSSPTTKDVYFVPSEEHASCGAAFSDAPSPLTSFVARSDTPAAPMLAHFWPQPSLVTFEETTLWLPSDLKVDFDASVPILKEAVHRFQQRYQKSRPLHPDQLLPLPSAPATLATLGRLSIRLQSTNDTLDLTTDESYRLTVSLHGSEWLARLHAPTLYGAMHGLETFLQLYGFRKSESADWQASHGPSSPIRVIENAPWVIEDAPRFQHRGFMLDTARHFFPVATLCKMIDAMAMNKMNVFHWHIVDAQSFPLHVEALPYLSLYGAYSAQQVYRPTDVLLVVEYAKRRGIRVIPELDMPGHAYSWGRGYPQLTVCGAREPYGDFAAAPPAGQLNPVREDTYTFIKALLGELKHAFPDTYFHMGMDEVTMSCWHESEEIRSYLNTTGSTDQELLQFFLDRVESDIRSNNKLAIAWEDSVLRYGLTMPKDTVLQVWSNANSVKSLVQAGYSVICSFYTSWYLDIGLGSWVEGVSHGPGSQSPLFSWQQMYLADPAQGLTAEEEARVLGGEALMWTEMVNELNVESIVWPRASAVAERLWSAKGTTVNHDTTMRLQAQVDRMNQMDIRASPIQPDWCRKGKCRLGSSSPSPSRSHPSSSSISH